MRRMCIYIDTEFVFSITFQTSFFRVFFSWDEKVGWIVEFPDAIIWPHPFHLAGRVGLSSDTRNLALNKLRI